MLVINTRNLKADTDCINESDEMTANETYYYYFGVTIWWFHMEMRLFRFKIVDTPFFCIRLPVVWTSEQLQEFRDSCLSVYETREHDKLFIEYIRRV